MQSIWLVQGTGLVFVDTFGITPPVYVPLGSSQDTATVSIDYSGNNLVSVRCSVINVPSYNLPLFATKFFANICQFFHSK